MQCLAAHSSHEAVSSLEPDCQREGRQAASADSSSQSSEDSVRREQRQRLGETTERVLQQVTAILRSEQPGEESKWPWKGLGAEHVPVFDKRVDYVAKVREQSEVLAMVQTLHETHA